MGKKTAVLGASPNNMRYSFRAVEMLASRNHEVIPLGLRSGQIDGVPIVTNWPEKIEGLDTLTLYVGAKNQHELYDYVIGLNPKRIIFNPGTENPELMQLAREKGIKVEAACTLVLLSIGNY